jgi:hypothetical protein
MVLRLRKPIGPAKAFRSRARSRARIKPEGKAREVEARKGKSLKPEREKA